DWYDNTSLYPGGTPAQYSYDDARAYYLDKAAYIASTTDPVILGGRPGLPARFPALSVDNWLYLGDSIDNRLRFDDLQDLANETVELVRTWIDGIVSDATSLFGLPDDVTLATAGVRTSRVGNATTTTAALAAFTARRTRILVHRPTAQSERKYWSQNVARRWARL